MFQFSGFASFRIPYLQYGGLPHSEICGYNGYLLLTAAYRSLSRPSSPADAKASPMCPCLLPTSPFRLSRSQSKKDSHPPFHVPLYPTLEADFHRLGSVCFARQAHPSFDECLCLDYWCLYLTRKKLTCLKKNSPHAMMQRCCAPRAIGGKQEQTWCRTKEPAPTWDVRFGGHSSVNFQTKVFNGFLKKLLAKPFWIPWIPTPETP